MEYGTTASREYSVLPNSPSLPFPKFVFQTDPHNCLTRPELLELQQRWGKIGVAVRFQQREAEYRVNGPRFMNEAGSERMKTARKFFFSLQKEHERLFCQKAKDTVEDDEEKILFFKSNLIKIIMTIDGKENSIGHSHLVTRYTKLLNRALGMTGRSFSVHMERGAALHDIGKIGIPVHILRKNGSLTPEERKAIREHPFLGYELVEDYHFLRKSARIVLFHHEKFDGSGYPYGLKGNEIPLEARIFAVVDAFDAITSDRHYSQARSMATAVREIKKGSGSHFDPDVVDAFLSVPLDLWQRTRRDDRNLGLSELVH
jgi:HD-GYP domain-containing protein (c-di-GMP phosphodiesterase class II)